MSLAWMGRRALRYLVALGLLAVLVYALTRPQPPKVGFATAIAGVPVNRTAPPITGDVRLGGVLTCSNGVWNDTEQDRYTYDVQWVRDNQDLTGETAANHTITQADIGRAIRCDVRATGSDGWSEEAGSLTYYPPAPSALTPPRVTGDLRLGRTLSCSRGTWNDDGLPAYPTTIQWLRNNEPIAGQTASHYTVTSADMGKYVACRVSVAQLTSSTATALYPTSPAIRSIPAITGDLRLGGKLTCSRGTWDDEGITAYATTKQWLRGGQEILGADTDEYTVRLADIDQPISCRVRAADLTDSTASNVYPTSPAQRSQPGIEGDPRLGRTLTCTRGTWDDAGRASQYGVAYEWYRNSNILVGQSANYDVTALDVDKPLRCQVIVEGKTEASSPTVYGVPPRALSIPTLTGDARLGRTLTCSRGTWDDPATAYAVTYQWLRQGTPIDGATSATYATTAADVNRGLSCRVTAAGFTTSTSTGVTVQPPQNFLPPHLEGDPRVGSTLTCTRGNWDDPATPYATTIQWYRGSSTVIADATAATYTVQAGDTSVHCRVTAATFTTANSPSATITTQATGPTAVNLIAPAISGDRRLGGKLTCSRGSWNDPATPHAVTYRWRRGTVNIVGATTNEYTITADDMTAQLNCLVTANGTLSVATPSYQPTAPEVIIAPAMTGDPRLRQTMTCNRGSWHEDGMAEPYTISYRWFRNSTVIPGATAATYKITEAELGTSLYCEARAALLTASGSAGVGVGNPRSVLGQVLSGQPRLRKQMSCSRGTWDDIAEDRYAVTFQWLRDGAPITDKTAATYDVVAGDTAHSISCQARAENLSPTSPFNGAETVRAPLNRVPPRLSGMPRLRQQLACTRGDWDDETTDPYAVTYRWFRGNDPIPNQTATTYTVVRADLAQSIHCRVRAEDLTEAQSAAITIRRPDNLVAPTISGDLRLFRTLSCSRGDWDDTAADRYAVTYSWYRNNVLVPGAASSTYVIGHDDMNKGLYCRVRAEDNIDANSGTVYPDLPRAILPPQISGKPHLRGELSCTRGTWDDSAERRYTVSYQWYRSGTPINGATNPTYVLGTADLNRYITCTATAEVLRDSSASSLYVYGPYDTESPYIEGIAHPRRELTCTRGVWNDTASQPYVLTYQWRRNDQPIAGADGPDHIVVAEDVGQRLNCAVTAEGVHTATSWWVYPTWEPLRIGLLPDADATGPNAFNAYTLRVRNDNPTAVAINTLELTLPGGFFYRDGTTTGALTSEPTKHGVGSLTLRWTQDFTVPQLGEAIIRVGVTAGSDLGDFLASARAIPVDNDFTTPTADRTARITVEAAEPAGGACTINGTPGNDVLTGTPGPDVICGLAGNDEIQGLAGDDELWGGPGDDRLDGGEDDDVLRGGDGSDVLDGEAGGDVMRGGGGLDTITYAARIEPVHVTVGVDEGDDGAEDEGDTVSSDAEIIRGGRGDDELIGSPGPEELYGRAGNDLLEGGDGAGDLLDGGDGQDTLSDDDRLVDRVFCGGDWDRFNADLLDRVVGCEESFSIESEVE